MSVSTYIIQFEESYFISVIDGLRDSRSRLAQTYITLRELVRAVRAVVSDNILHLY